LPPNSSRSRMLMFRAACDLVQVPERFEVVPQHDRTQAVVVTAQRGIVEI
jgi:hypothetical protein